MSVEPFDTFHPSCVMVGIDLRYLLELEICRTVTRMGIDRNSLNNWQWPSGIGAACLIICVLLAAYGALWMAALWLGILLSAVLAVLVYRSRRIMEGSLQTLEMPFHLSHDAAIFERYTLFSQQLLRISQRSSKVYRELALQHLDEMTRRCVELGQGLIVFSETETWRLAYERLLREPTVFHYRSIAIVRHPRYWQDAAGWGSMQFNFQLIDEQVITIERIVVIADDLWPQDQDLPTEELRQWIHEQSVHGIWISLVRISDLKTEPQLIQDLGIYGQLAVGTQELADDHLRTQRFLLNFDLNAIRDAERLWEKLRVYSVAYKEILDQFRL